MGEWNRDQQILLRLLIPLLCIVNMPSAVADNVTRSSRSPRIGALPYSNSKYITFNSLDDKIGIDFDLSIPFISIPMDPYGSKGLVNINAKALTIVGIFTALTTILVPLLVKPETLSHYRSDDGNQGWWNYGETARQIFLGNSRFTPCTKKFICSVVSNACHAKSQTSMDKIIDGVSGHAWFDQMVQGSAIQEAVLAGRKSESDCNVVYSGCFLSKKFFKSFGDTTTNS